jgi:multiple sugar transport system permease protein
MSAPVTNDRIASHRDTRPASSAARRRLVARRLRRLLRYGLVSLMVVWVLAPFYFLLLVSVQTRADSLRVPPNWFPVPDFGNYVAVLERAFSEGPASTPSDLIFPGIRNSAVVAGAVALLNVVVGASAGYSFARFRFPGNRAIPLGMLASQMVPAFAIIVPYYIVLRNLELTNTRIGVVIALLSVTLPFTIWLLRSYFQGIPLEIERAARMDGCSRFTVFWRVVLPLARPGLISAGLFAFMVSWNDFLFATILNTNTDSMLVQPAITGLYNVRQQSFGLMGAGSLVAALPTMLFALVVQRYLVRGLLSGAGKV